MSQLNLRISVKTLISVRAGQGSYGLTKERNTDDVFLKIPLYCKIFLKMPIQRLFSASQVFVCISRVKFFEDLTIVKLNVL